MKNLLSIVFVLAVVLNAARSQSVNSFTAGGPKIDQLCPEFSFDTLFNYSKEKLSLAELKGKFVIVDFWGTFCLPCIAAFPKLEKWQKQFGDSLQILLVATDGYQKTKLFYETRIGFKDQAFLRSVFKVYVISKQLLQVIAHHFPYTVAFCIRYINLITIRIIYFPGFKIFNFGLC